MLPNESASFPTLIIIVPLIMLIKILRSEGESYNGRDIQKGKLEKGERKIPPVCLYGVH